VNIIQWSVELRFVVALALGFLVGLQRESLRFEQRHLLLGGVRTYPLLSLFGFGCAWLDRAGIGFMLPLGLLAVAVLAGLSYFAKIRQSEHFGITTEVAALLTFITGALALMADIWVPMALGIVTTFLLSEKTQLEDAVRKLNQVEFLAAVKFLLVTLIILPALPNRDYTRFELNPTEVWKMVILVASVGFLGYVLTKRLGGKIGLWLSGLVGGIVSSTAVTIASGRIAGRDPARGRSALQAATLACSVMYIRLLVLLAVVSPALIPSIWWRLAALAAAGLLLTLGRADAAIGTAGAEDIRLQNPFELKPALVFAALFALLSVASVLVREAMGNAGLLSLSALTGLTDIDPFILSLVRKAAPVLTLTVKAMFLAMMSNTLVKGVYFGVLAPGLRKQAAWRFGLWTVLHIPFILIP
jgi:uncharacterized membrane protein (DUF4010 family)